MPDENNKDFYKQLFKILIDFLQPAINLFKDPTARAEYFETLGLDLSGVTVEFPDTQNLNDYLESEEVDTFEMIGAMADLGKIISAIEGIIRAGVDSQDDPAFATEEIFAAVMNMLWLDFIRRKSPELYAGINLAQTISAQTAAEGGIENFYEDTIRPFFANLFRGLESEESTAALSHTIFITFVTALFFLDKYVLEKTDDFLEIKAGYGYEGVVSDEASLVDEISNRFANFSVTVHSTKPINQVSSYNTFGFVPKTHGGEAFIFDLSGELDTTIDFSDKLSLKLDSSGEGVFRIGESADITAGKNNKVIAKFKHDRSKADKWTLMDAPIIKLGLGTYTITFKADKNDFEIKAKVEIQFEFGKGDKTGFPWSFLPEKIDEKKSISFGYSYVNKFFFGDNTPGNSAAEPATTPTNRTSVSSLRAESEDPSFIEGSIAKLLNMVDLRVPMHQLIGGVLGLEILNLRTGVQGNLETLALETSLDFYVKFGAVLTISISRLGFQLSAEKSDEDGKGHLFGYDLKPKVKPPNGAGIIVDAAIIKGGGFLYFDDEKGEYFGSLELEFKELFTLKAIGIINTKMPDGTNGFSMLIIITAEFTPVQLGFGFTLSGVGGLLGIDRRADVETLRLGLKTNAIKSVLFPQDVVGNIHRIVNDLKQIFPIQENTFLIGLMAQLGWSNNLLKIELGLILEIPDPKILILGVIKLSLPDESAEVLRLQVNFLGVIDFQNKFVYFEAHLFDSMLFGFTLTGSLAFGVGWGNTALFGISVGGFHPDFRDYPNVPTLPGAFRAMDRIGLNLLEGDNPKLTLEAYFAVTSNSLQFGAKLELLAEGPMGFNLYGLLAFDALFIFDPFSFIISLEATLAIRKGRKILFGIHFRGQLSGPRPWHIEGSVTFGILFFDVTIGFSETWGDPPIQIASTTTNLLALIEEQLYTIENWSTKTAAHQHEYVSIRNFKDEVGSPLVLNPFGELEFIQRTIPLNINLEKYGNTLPQNENRFSFSEIKIGDDIVDHNNVIQAKFAAGNYIKLSEKEKLNRKSFEFFDAGFRLTDSGKLATAKPEIDTIILDYEVNYTEDDQPPQRHKLSKGAFAHLGRNAAISKSEASWAYSKSGIINKPRGVTITKEKFTVANTNTFKEVDTKHRATTKAEATNILNQLIAENPALKNELQVVEEFELVF